MASVSLCSSLTTRLLSLNQTLTLSSSPKPNNLTFFSHSLSHSLSSQRLISSRTLTFVSKSSQTEAPVIEEQTDPVSEPIEVSEPVSEPVEVSVPSIEKAKREEIFAVVMIGGRQYIVFPGRFIHTQRFKGANVNDKVILNKVLLVGTKTSTYVGKPIVPNAAVHAVVEEQGLNKKVVVFKYKKKKNYRRNIGHRQPNTRIRILGITGYENTPATTLEETSTSTTVA